MHPLDDEGKQALQEIAGAISRRTDAGGALIVVVDFKTCDDENVTNRAIDAQIVVRVSPALERYLPVALLRVAAEIAARAAQREAHQTQSAAEAEPAGGDDQQTTQC
jgi:hypothetical protein